ncbi:hypothetical protein HCN44_005894 [Aphidius gifuensis]|uniref:Dynein axonemal assembly factor 1 homolog n=1 Tax=Aphidius gifuensis TaxID=684658 RepID=A0A834XV53_APHGI|nr:tubulin-specific chaperone E [Aphidius gifuensis]KAF7993113.1 hypothetical protein HCN44_005894 [Aphidius gifuensis]
MVEDVQSVGVQDVKTGQRIECDGQRGTICYVGPVDGTNGTWLGIDWDNPTRGKHNGTYNNKLYFKTRHSTSGSFVRPGKINTGISCPTAIKNRYGFIDDELAGVDKDNITSLRKEINAPFLEMVGFSKVNKKQSTFDRLKIVWLREQCVSSYGNDKELEELCPNIFELDLSKNLFNSWETIANICTQLKKLERLNVSENTLGTKIDLIEMKNSFLNVKNLTISRMDYDWRDIQLVTSIFPSLKTLSVPFNKIDFLEKPISDTSLEKIVDLTLEGNSISSWNEVLKLGHLSCLENLNVNSNKIEKIRFTTLDDKMKTDEFSGLRNLHLSNNLISDWQSISELEKLKNLEELRFRDNPVLTDIAFDTVRQLIIAKISELKILNGTEIHNDERKGAEYDYLKLYANEWLNIEKNKLDNLKIEFVNEHPRYPVLVGKYGSPERTNLNTPVEMESNVITVEFVCMNEQTTQKSTKRKLMKDMDVQKLTGLAQKLFQTGRKVPKLSFVQPNLSKEEIPLDMPLQQLCYYSIQNGDRVLVRW